MSFVDCFIASFLYCFPYSCRSFTLLKGLAKGTVIFSLSPFRARKSDKVGRAITLEKKPPKKKKRTDTKKDAKRIKTDNITLQGAREKSNIAIAILELNNE